MNPARLAEALPIQTSGLVSSVVGRGDRCVNDVRARVEALRRVAHPGLMIPADVRLDHSGDVVVATPRAVGMDLSAVIRARGSLTAGECVAVGMDVADALAALHAGGLAHGDVSLANVVITPRRAVLIDLIGGPDERGTDGFSPAERGHGATAAGDVYSLGRVLMAIVTPADRDRIAAWARPLLVETPESRPSAAQVSIALRTCADPAPVTVPELGVAAALRSLARDPEASTLKTAEGRGWRIRTQTVRAFAALLALVVTAIAFIVVSAATDAAVMKAPDDPVVALPLPATMIATTPADAAVALTLARFAAIGAGDADRLEATTTASSPARAADESLVGQLEAGAVRFGGLDVDVVSTEGLPSDGDDAVVRIVYRISDYTLTLGSDVETVAAVTATADLTLRWSPGCGWQVVSVDPHS